MKIQLGKISCKDNWIYKEQESFKTVSGTLREPCSVFEPSILIDVSDIDKAGSTPSQDVYIWQANYAYIEEWHRYYYITDVRYESNTMARLTMKEDVLMSYYAVLMKSGNVKGVVSRDSDDADSHVRDDLVNFTGRYHYSRDYQAHDDDTYGKAEVWNHWGSSDAGYVLAYIPGNVDNANYNDGVAVELPHIFASALGTVSGYENIIEPFFNSVAYVQMVLTSYFFRFTAEHESATSAILSLCFWPFSQKTSSNTTTVPSSVSSILLADGKDGVSYSPSSYGATGDSALLYPVKTKFHYMGYIIFSGVSAYHTLSNYSWMWAMSTPRIYLPYYGWVSIDTSRYLYKEKIHVGFIPNNLYGTGIYMIVGESSYAIDTYEAQVGVSVPITHSNSEEIKDRYTKLGIQSAVALTASALEIGVGAYTGHAFMVAGGVSTAVSTVGNMIAAPLTTHPSASATVKQAPLSYYDGMRVMADITWPEPVQLSYPDGFVADYGRPRCEYKSLGDYSKTADHYVRFQSVSAINIPTATDRERKEIEQYLLNGVHTGVSE